MRGSVRKPKGAATWIVTVDVGTDPVTGKRKQLRRRGFKTRKLAEAALARILNEASQGTYAEPSDEPLGRFLEEWLAAVRTTVRASTWAGYAQKLRTQVEPRLGRLPLRAVDAPRLNTLYADLLTSGRRNGAGGGLSARSVVSVHKILHRALRDAVRWGKLRTNPADQADPPRAVPVEMRVWTAEQLRSFLAHVADDRLRGLWVLAASTGMRRGELLGLRWVDIDFEVGQVAVRRALVAVGYEVVEGEPKSGRARTVALDPQTLGELRAHRTRQLEERLAWGEAWTDTGYVFAREDGTAIHPQSVSKFFEKQIKAAGVPVIRLHDVRHTHATLGLEAGVPVKVMQERLGHANAAITLDLYTHVVPGMQQEAAAKVAALIFGVTNP